MFVVNRFIKQNRVLPFLVFQAVMTLWVEIAVSAVVKVLHVELVHRPGAGPGVVGSGRDVQVGVWGLGSSGSVPPLSAD